ncbi:lytic polysaccharide monooxygenase [Paenibacillus agilis]|uniref:Chitin-binding protein n=1 Tax=Paenibacillus agilis TaxID=3020863 RepID=A0A559IZ72_9BACL|nr:lytic polysaccharide monooxygenase [Paenibacillus agilis]TVX92928.1 chitin-binding protein [Paenibacillus agilis]
MMQLRLSNPVLSKLLVATGVTVLVTACTLMFADKVSAHGYVLDPKSRTSLCATGVNTNCGPVQYEPQSLEGPKGFPAAGPSDGKLASAADPRFSAMDEQSATRWSKVNLTGGPTTFAWKKTANHATTNWKYYLTKPNWNQNAALTRDSFNLTPFCTADGGGKQPPKDFSHSCNVPTDRTGYHVILAVWEIADTPNAFYNVIDVNFGGQAPTDTVAPTAPASLSATGTTTTSVSLAWNAASDNVGVTGYQIFNGSTLIGSVSGSTLNYTAAGLTSNTAYTFTVKAVDAAGNVSGASNAVSATTAPVANDTTAPTAPTYLHKMTVTANSVSLMWTESTDNVGVTGYQVYNGNTLVATVPGTAIEYNVTGLTANTAYSFKVRAIDAAGNVSADSNILTVTTTSAGTGTPGAAAWAPNTAYAVGTEVTFNNVTYVCRLAHTSLNGWEPTNTPALWQVK